MNRTILGKVCNIVMGQSPIGSSYNEIGEGVALINGPTEFTDKYPIKRQWTNKRTKLCKKDDILICVRGSSTGRMNIANDTYCIGRGVAAISGRSDVALTEYIYYLLDFEVNNILLKSAGSTFPNITSKELNELPIMLFDSTTQKNIVEILKTWDKAIDLKQKLLQEKLKQKQGLMQRLLTGKIRIRGFNGVWKVTKISKILEESKELEENPSFERLLSVRLHLQGVNKRVVTGSEVDGATTVYTRRAGQFIYGKQNFHNGSMGIVPKELDGFASSADIPSFNFRSGYSSKYFYYYWARTNYYKELESLTTGTGSKRLNPKEFLSVSIKIPDYQEQNKIMIILDKASEEINLLEKEIELLKKQKKGLMQLLLSGIVRVNCD
ncbi:hypothetical protein GCM10008908_31630 [Clostridium subterminale]|uniref:Type I restriction modification DNA specificity domain-containing protein n=1 Tax=Clostridium subterminale TaxID=1550 RepID=A0ABP3W4I5_CLOSU